MYLIAKQKGGHQAIPIKSGDRWDFHKLLVGRNEVRIILRLRGRRYLLYHTRELTQKYPGLRRENLIPLCDEIMERHTSILGKSQQPPNAAISDAGVIWV